MCITDRLELNTGAADDAPTDEGPEVSQKDLVLVLRNAVVDLSTLW